MLYGTGNESLLRELEAGPSASKPMKKRTPLLVMVIGTALAAPALFVGWIIGSGERLFGVRRTPTDREAFISDLLTWIAWGAWGLTIVAVLVLARRVKLTLLQQVGSVIGGAILGVLTPIVVLFGLLAMANNY